MDNSVEARVWDGWGI